MLVDWRPITREVGEQGAKKPHVGQEHSNVLVLINKSQEFHT